MFKRHSESGHLVSDEGQILKKRGSGLKVLSLSTAGYYHFSAMSNLTHKQKQFFVHRVVCEAFIGEIPDRMCVNHKNCNKLDNRLSNLEIVSYQHNSRHAWKNDLMQRMSSETNGMAKLTDEEYLEIVDLILKGESNSSIATRYGLHSRYVSLIRGKKRLKNIWAHYERLHGSVMVIPQSGDKSHLSFSERLNLIDKLRTHPNIDLAIEYGLDASCVSRIRSKKTWKNVWQVYEQGTCNDHPETE